MMPNNTETYWEADGQSLHTYARSIETIGGMGPPEFRGDDHTIPLQPGQTWVPKVFDSNIISLAMWVRGVAQDAGAGAHVVSKQNFQSNWNDLIRLLWTPGRQVALRKRFYDGGILRVATAMAEYAGGLQPSMIGRFAGRCTVDMKIARGVFFSDTETSVPLVNGDNTVNVLGNAPTTAVRVTINGARQNTRVLNRSLGVGFTYPDLVAAGANAVVNADDYSVVHSGINFDKAPSIIHSGAAQWMILRPGANVINLASDSGTGTVQLQYRAAWV